MWAVTQVTHEQACRWPLTTKALIRAASVNPAVSFWPRYLAPIKTETMMAYFLDHCETWWRECL